MEKPEGLTLSRIKALFEQHMEKQIWVYKQCSLCGCKTELLSSSEEYRADMHVGCINCRHSLYTGFPSPTRVGSVLLWDDKIE
jgi:uridine phosphorylase